jgi:hypothetical protein
VKLALHDPAFTTQQLRGADRAAARTDADPARRARAFAAALAADARRSARAACASASAV